MAPATRKPSTTQVNVLTVAIENSGMVVPGSANVRTLAAMETAGWIVRATATYGVTPAGYRAAGRDDIADRIEAEWAALEA